MEPQAIANLVAQGKVAEAIELLLPEIEREPNNADLLSLLACCKAAENKHDEALEIVKQAIEIEPENLNLKSYLGVLYSLKNDRRSARDVYEAILAIDPNHIATLNNLSLVYADLEDFEAAIRASDRLTRLEQNSDYLFNRANFLVSAGRFEEALVGYQDTLALKESPAYHFNCAHLLLSLGRWREAYPHFEKRFGLHSNSDASREILLSLKPEWRGQPLNGETVLFYCGQGMGDLINFTRLIVGIKERGAGSVLLECPHSLCDLFESCPGVDDLIEFKRSVPYSYRTNEPLDFDYHISEMSLLSALNVEPNAIPGKCPYLRPKDNRAFFDNYSGMFKVGVVWCGNPAFPGDYRRSCPLRHFKPLSEIPGVKLFSLVKDSRPRHWPKVGTVDLCEGVDFTLVDLSSYLTTFDQTARIISQLDLVVTVDTSVAHLTGAIGQRGIVILARESDWRWLRDRSDSLWYPSLTLVRQEKPNDWERVLKSARALVDMETQLVR